MKQYNIDLANWAYQYVTEGVCLASFVDDMCKKYEDTPDFKAVCISEYNKQKQAFEYSNY